MQFSVAANYDTEAVRELARWPVTEVYGKLPTDVAGGGRPSYMATPIGRRQFASYVRELSNHGIAFNYLLNSACLGNREWSRVWQSRLTRLLRWLEEIGVTTVTVSTPFLLERIRHLCPSMRIKAGIFAQIDTVRRARFWADLGADALTLESFSINRNFARLRAIRAAVDCEIQLIANHLCLPNCPLQPYHQNGFAHASDGSGRIFLDYCFFECTRQRLSEPARFIQAQWIRPEDVGAYEKLGVDTLKILERGMPTDTLLHRVSAYGNRSFEGNLADLMLSYAFRHPVRKPGIWFLRHFLRPWQINPLRLRSILEVCRRQGMMFAVETPPVQIRAAKIPADFLDGFLHRDCSNTDCGECGYCARIASDTVLLDPQRREEFIGQLESVHDLLVKGEAWNAP